MSKEQFKRRRKIESASFLKMDAGDSAFIEIVTSFKPILIKKKQAVVMGVINLKTGEKMQLIVPAMLQTIIEEEYVDSENIIGKCFEVVKGDKTLSESSGNHYSTMELYEIDKEDVNNDSTRD